MKSLFLMGAISAVGVAGVAAVSSPPTMTEVMLAGSIGPAVIMLCQVALNRRAARTDAKDTKIEALQDKYLEEKFTNIDGRFCNIDDRLERGEKKFDDLARKIDGLVEHVMKKKA